MALKTVKLEPGSASPESDESSKPEAPAPAAAKSHLRKKFLPVAGVVAALAAARFGGDWLHKGRFEIRNDNAQIRADITRVTPKVQGYVTAVHVDENQPVKAGDLLISLEAADFEARVA
jgi:membrane fusion protein (multidrug efflux system)